MKYLWIFGFAGVALSILITPALCALFVRLSIEQLLALSAVTMVVLILTIVLVTMTFPQEIEQKKSAD